MSGKYLMAALAPLFLSSCVAAQTPSPQPEPDPFAAWTEACEDWDDWDKPGPPFRVHGNTYYVGTCGIGAIFIAGEEDHVIIDGGTAAGAEVILANIASLGFDPADISIILASHEHHDHVGGLARISEVAGEGVIVPSTVLRVYQTGEPDPRDPQFAIAEQIAPVEIDSIIGPGMRVGPSDIRNWVTAIGTPGHTPGALSWRWRSCEGEDCVTIVYADSLSAVSSDEYRFSDHPEYVAEFRAGIARLAELDCDILLTPHPSASGMRQKLLDGDLTSGMDCAVYAADRLARLEERLAREMAEVAGE